VTERTVSVGEELASSVSHGVGLALSLVALPALVVVAQLRHDPWLLLSGTIFGLTLVLLYGASTVYHALPRGRAKDLCRVADHVAIYLLIAGTFTPFALGVLRGPLGWTLLVTLWGLAAVGIALKTTIGFRYPRLSTTMYLAMGWMAVFAIQPLASRAGLHAVAWIVAGGLCYTLGVVFYARERIRYGHFIWHLFVLGGSACHFVAVLWYAGAA
jgi:hemolysin III